ncbi:MAG TPA: ATP-binding protein [Caulobacteraceae bacterium]|nr:ATP-binding protein [Caulobacteraceae bacterium]
MSATRTLSRRFLLSVAITSMAITALACVGAFLVFERELEQRQIAYLADYVRERSGNVDRRFASLADHQRAAAQELARRMDRLSPADADRLVAMRYPLGADGARRSRAEAFDGAYNGDGGYTYGMGAFLGRAGEMTPQDRAVFAAAYDVVASFGPALHAENDNFYFFTPKATRLVIFGPDRPDRLMFYRHDAPADLDISHEEMTWLTTPANDPSRATRCTNLQRLLQDNHGERLATACLTPAYAHGRYLGAFGSSLDLTGFFQSAVSQTLPGATSLVVTDKAELIAYPGFATPGRASPETVSRYERDLGLKATLAAIRRQGGEHGVIARPDAGQIIAYGRLRGPNWYLLMSYPRQAIMLSAARSASWILIVGLFATVVLPGIVVMLARRSIVRPLERLAASCQPGPDGEIDRTAASTEALRRDEIGVLARALISEREKVDEVLHSLEERVQARTAELERANAEKSRFLANMSHELRTPLNGVIAISETLAAQQRTRRGRDLAELIVSSGRLLEQVLTDILDFSKIEAGEIALAREPFVMEAMVRRIAELHRASAETKGLAFAWEVAPAARGAWIGDPVRLTQILSNLLSNAVKFTEAGQVRLAVSAGPEGLVFSVADTGIGFDDEVRARLFRRFEQADASIRRRFGGTGLGLAISRSLAELMGGRIDVVSVPGQGSTFTMTAPLQRAGAGAAQPEEAEAEDFVLAGRRILLAEDHPTNQKVVQLILEAAGLELDIVENGAAALERLAARDYDLVLMDMQMPELDGLTATSLLRERERATGARRTPVVMLTANALDEHVRMSREAGADEHLSKPIRAASLFETIARLLAAADAQAAAVA